jgi:hypothetical protein
MAKSMNRLSVALRWAAGIWLVGWSLHVVFRQPLPPSMSGTLIDVAALLIPAALLFAASCAATWFERQADVAPSLGRTGH